MDGDDRRRSEVEALVSGHAFVVASHLSCVEVRGPDGRPWLHDLLTADVASLEAGRARRSLLLTPTGRIRADLVVGCAPDGFVLLQERGQGDDVAEALSPYVLSSAVELRRTPLVVLTTCAAPASAPAGLDLSPSHLGVGHDLLRDDPTEARAELGRAALTEIEPGRLDDLRVRLGSPRIGVDYEAGALPAEAGLSATIDVDKGCFLGQESVAKVRELGHPPSVLRHVRAHHELVVGDDVHGDRGVVGHVTSSTPLVGGYVGLVRVAWDAAEGAIRTPAGHPLWDVPGPG